MKKRHLWTLFPKNLIKIEFYTNIKMAFLKFHLFWPLMNFSQLISYWALIYMNKQCLNNIPWVCTISESKNLLRPTVLRAKLFNYLYLYYPCDLHSVIIYVMVWGQETLPYLELNRNLHQFWSWFRFNRKSNINLACIWCFALFTLGNDKIK